MLIWSTESLRSCSANSKGGPVEEEGQSFPWPSEHAGKRLGRGAVQQVADGLAGTLAVKLLVGALLPAGGWVPYEGGAGTAEAADGR